MTLRDMDIRYALREELSKRFANSHTIIVDELRISWGDTRVDLAVVNCNLHGYEIKSDRDTLERLPRQVELYNKIFDTMTLVASIRWLHKIYKIIPEWWGVMVPYPDDTVETGVSFRLERSAQNNLGVELRSLVELTWKDEALSMLAERGLARGFRSKPRWDIWDHMVEVMDPQEIKDCVRECLKSRQEWRTPDSLRRLDAGLCQC